jgi:hypothetical protein
MDYTILKEEQLIDRLNSIPSTLQSLVTSEIVFRKVQQIAEANHLLDAEKVEMLSQLIGLVILGFVSKDNLAQEINQNLHLNYKHAKNLAQEIDSKIFAAVSNELEAIYKPPEEPEGEKREKKSSVPFWEPKKPPKFISLEAIGGELPKEEKIPISEEKPPETDESKPLIIHEEKPLVEERERPTKKIFSLPFELFKKKGERPIDATQGKPVKVKIETPDQPERVVHYSELRTPIPTFGEDDSINLETLETFAAPKAEIPTAATAEKKSSTQPEIPAASAEIKIPIQQPEIPVAETPGVSTVDRTKPALTMQEKPENPILREIAEKVETAAREPKTEERTSEKQPFWKKMFTQNRVEELGKKETSRFNPDQNTDQRGSQSQINAAEPTQINTDRNLRKSFDAVQGRSSFDQREPALSQRESASVDNEQPITGKRLRSFKIFGRKSKEAETDSKITTDDKTVTASEKKTEGPALKGNIVDLSKH